MSQTPEEESTEAQRARITELEEENEELTRKLADRDETIENLKAEINEQIDEKSDLIDEKRALVDETHELAKDILELQQERQQLQAKPQQQEPNRESESSPSEPATDAPPESDQLGANETTDTESLSNGQRWVRDPNAPKPDPIPEQYEQLFGKPLPETLHNGNPETTEPERENDRDGRDDTEQERDDDDTRAGGPTF